MIYMLTRANKLLLLFGNLGRCIISFLILYYIIEITKINE